MYTFQDQIPSSLTMIKFFFPLQIVFFLALALTGEMFILEKREGLLDRSWVAGVQASEVLVSHVFTQFLILCGQTAITLVFIFIVFGIPCQGPVGWVIGLTLMQGTAGMCYGKDSCYYYILCLF